jgi:carboxypeptidase family protein/TonB-dependent receptor-like protein
MLASYKESLRAALVIISYLAVGLCAYAQSAGNSSSVTGTVLDPSGAVVPNAIVEIRNPVSGFQRTVTTDATGGFAISNIPFNPYHLTVTAPGFGNYVQEVDVRSVVPVNLSIKLRLESSETVNVEASGGDLVENDSTFHTDVDKSLFDKLPLESVSSGLSSLVTEATPGIAADSSGKMHGLGDHAENAISLDGQPITDQFSKEFSNQIPTDAIQSLEVIAGAPPAEYGDKTSIVMNVTTRSGQGMSTPQGSITTSYGSFGTSNIGFNLGYGGKNWGDFVSASGLNGGRFLDPAEFKVSHDKGNTENLFDRVDYQISTGDSIHLNLGYTRSWFQTPNSLDAQLVTSWKGLVVNNGGLGSDGLPVGPTDQRTQIQTFNIAPSWTRLLNNNTVFTLGAYVRRDHYNYYPSKDPFADLAPAGLQSESVGQDRTLTNAGLRSDLSYVKGAHNLKIGATYSQTFLNEHDNLGIVDPTFNDPSSLSFNPALAPYDLTRGGHLFAFNGHTDVKELALYVDDTITEGNWNFRVGVRGDFYNGLVTHREGEPRVGISYNIKPSNTILRVSYARVLETPFNENLVLSSVGCVSSVLNPLLACSSSLNTPLSPGWRNEFHAGIEQAFGKYLVFSGEYIWKYTHNGFDFSILGSTPITFPVEWDRSKIPGFAGRVSVPNFHGFSAQTVFSSVAARYFTPQLGGAGATPSAPSGVFRIDHDEKFNQTTHFQYQIGKLGPWVGFNWRYDSGLVAGPIPCAGGNCNNGPAGTNTVVDTSILSPDQEFEAGLFCGSVHALAPSAANPVGVPISSSLGANLCPASQYGSTLIKVPAGTENDDKNPPRIAPRHLFDLAIGDDNLFHGDKRKWSAQLTVINVANRAALYNFLSTFSGTHYVTPRTVTGQIGFNF